MGQRKRLQSNASISSAILEVIEKKMRMGQRKRLQSKASVSYAILEVIFPRMQKLKKVWT